MSQIVLDVETKKLFSEVEDRDPTRLGVSYAGIWHLEDETALKPNLYRGFFEEELADLWPVLEGAKRLIGFNIIGFDLPTLSPYYAGDLARLPVLDILEKIREVAGHRVSLEAVAQATLSLGKSGSGLKAIEYWRAGERDKLAEYCRQDVKVTAEVYQFGLKNGFLRFYNKWNNLKEVPVDFSLPKIVDKVQMTLGV